MNIPFSKPAEADATNSSEYVGAMIELCNSRRAVCLEHRYIEEAENARPDSAPRVIINTRLPLAEVVTDFFDELKYRSSGYASFE